MFAARLKLRWIDSYIHKIVMWVKKTHQCFLHDMLFVTRTACMLMSAWCCIGKALKNPVRWGFLFPKIVNYKTKSKFKMESFTPGKLYACMKKKNPEGFHAMYVKVPLLWTAQHRTRLRNMFAYNQSSCHYLQVRIYSYNQSWALNTYMISNDNQYAQLQVAATNLTNTRNTFLQLFVQYIYMYVYVYLSNSENKPKDSWNLVVQSVCFLKFKDNNKFRPVGSDTPAMFDHTLDWASTYKKQAKVFASSFSSAFCLP